MKPLTEAEIAVLLTPEFKTGWTKEDLYKWNELIRVGV